MNKNVCKLVLGNIKTVSPSQLLIISHYVRVFWIYTFCTNLNGSNLRHLVAEFCQTCDDFSSSPLQMLHSYAECVVFRNNRDENLSERFLGNNKLPASKTAARGAAARALASSSAWAAVSSGHGPGRLDAGGGAERLSERLPTDLSCLPSNVCRVSQIVSVWSRNSCKIH